MTDEQMKGEMRGIGLRPDVVPGKIGEPIKPVDLQPISINLTDGEQRTSGALEDQGFLFRKVELPQKGSVQVLIYRKEEVNMAERLSQRAAVSLPVGLIKVKDKVVALPVAWTDTKTNSVEMKVLGDGAVRMTTVDRVPAFGEPLKVKKESVILMQGNVYPGEGLGGETVTGAFAEEHLGVPWADTLEGEPKPTPVTWGPSVGSFTPFGFYKSPPGSRYGFTGWVRPKKL